VDNLSSVCTKLSLCGKTEYHYTDRAVPNFIDPSSYDNKHYHLQSIQTERMGLTFDSPISISSSAYDKAHRRRSTLSALPSTKSTGSPSFLTNLKQSIRKPFRRPSDPIPNSTPKPSNSKPATTAADSPFFHLPLALREQIYGYVVGRDEVLHILLKKNRKAASQNSSGYTIVYRRCRACGNVNEKGKDCISATCKEFLDIVNGAYFGNFDSVGGLLLSCRDVYVGFLPYSSFSPVPPSGDVSMYGEF
jgi:hypothetical protein